MKILILTQNIQNITNMLSGLEQTKKLAATIGLNIEYTFQPTEKQFSVFKFTNPSQSNGAAINGAEIMNEVKGDYRIACLMYDWTKYTPQPTNPVTQGYDKNKVIPMQIPEQWYGEYPDVLTQYLLHEISHAGFFLSGQKDITHEFYSSEFSQMPDGINKFYLFLLKDLKQYLDKNTMPISTPIIKYNYFSQKEVDTFKLKPAFWTLLDKIRAECNFPISLNSGLRTKAENDELKDSVSDSAHLSGLACDINCTDSIKRLKLVQVALANGIKRIGIGSNFVHLDIDNTKPQNVMWTYYK